MIKYSKLLYLSYNDETELINKIYINLINNLFIKNEINVILDKRELSEVTKLEDYDAIILGAGLIKNIKKTIYAINKIRASEIPIILLDFQFSDEVSVIRKLYIEYLNKKINIDELKEKISVSQDIRVIAKACDEIGISGSLSKNILNVGHEVGFLLMKLDDIIDKSIFHNKILEEFLANYEQIIGIDYCLIENETSQNKQWIFEQLEIAVQIFLNKGYKIALYSISNTSNEDNKEVCRKFVNRFQNSNIMFVESFYNSEELKACIKACKFTINLSNGGNIISAAFGIPFVSIDKSLASIDFTFSSDLSELFIMADEINAGEIIKKSDYISSDYFEITEKMKKCIERNNKLQTKFFVDVFRSVKIREKVNIEENVQRNEIINQGVYPINKNEINRLHIGCGRTILDNWVNLDCVSLPGVDVVLDLDNCGNVPLPFEDNSIDEFLASHVIEHIKNPLPMMQELHRVAKTGAKAVFRCPYGSSDDAFEDPTHVRQYFLNSFGYFSQPFYWRADYGYKGDWKVEKIYLVVDKDRYKNIKPEEILKEVHLYRNIVKEFIVELIAVKPIREARKELQTPQKVEFILD